jgi:hypothetical protein
LLHFFSPDLDDTSDEAKLTCPSEISPFDTFVSHGPKKIYGHINATSGNATILLPLSPRYELQRVAERGGDQFGISQLE